MGFLTFIVKHNILGLIPMAAALLILIRRRSLIDTSEDTENKHNSLLIIALIAMFVGILILCSPLAFEIAGINLS